MVTYNSQGLPLYSSLESFPGWAAAFNSQSNLLGTALDDATDADHAADSVETIAELPVTGNWPGRIIWVEEDDRIRRWDGVGWGVVGFPPSLQTNPTVGSGWLTPSVNTIYQRSGWVQLNFNAFRTSTATAGQLIVEVPPGYRGDHDTWALAWDTFTTNAGPYRCYYDKVNEEVRLFEAVAEDHSIALTMMWPLEGAT